MVWGENYLSRQQSQLYLHWGISKVFPPSSQLMVHSPDGKESDRGSPEHTGPGTTMPPVLPTVTWERCLCHLSNRHSQRGTVTSEPGKRFEDEKCYLLSILISRGAAPLLITKMIHTQNSSILKEATSFQKQVKNKSVMMELIPTLPVLAHFTQQKVHCPLRNENRTQCQQEWCSRNPQLWAMKHS